jgi:hypothetical protein
MTPATQSRTDTGKFTVSDTTDNTDDFSFVHTIAGTSGSKAYKARELIAWTVGDYIINYTVDGFAFTDTIPVSVAGSRLAIGGAVSIDSTTAAGLDFTLVF